MPTTEFSFKELNSLLEGGEYRPEEIRDRISMLGVDIESLDDEKIVMEIFPNRPDMLGVEGFARALNGFLGVETGLVEYDVRESDIKVYVEKSVAEVRPHISVAVIRGLSLTEENLVALMNIQEKLHITHGRNRKKVAIGVHDLSRINGPYTYKAVGPREISFVPLGMEKKLDLAEILEEHPKGIEYRRTLEGFGKYPIIVDREGNVLSFPPIINGELTRVTKKTKDVFIDVTGTDQSAVSKALNILVAALVDRGGTAYAVELING